MKKRMNLLSVFLLFTTACGSSMEPQKQSDGPVAGDVVTAQAYLGEMVEEYRDADGVIFHRYVERRAYFEVEVEPDGMLRVDGFVFDDSAVYLDPEHDDVPHQFVRPLGEDYTYEVTGGTWSADGERLDLSVEGVLTFHDMENYEELVAITFSGVSAPDGEYPIEDRPLAGEIDGRAFEVATGRAWPKESGGYKIRLDAVQWTSCDEDEPESADQWVIVDLPARMESAIEFNPLDSRVMLVVASLGPGGNSWGTSGQLVVDEQTEDRIRGGLTAYGSGYVSGQFEATICDGYADPT